MNIPPLTRVVNALFMPRHSLLGDKRPTPLTYLYTQAIVVPRYIGLALLPLGLNVDHDVPFTPTLTRAGVVGAILLAALAVGALWLLPHQPLMAFGLLWFFVTLSVESSLLPIDDAMVEHRMYLPMAGLSVSVGWIVAVLIGALPRLGTMLGLAGAAALLFLTLARNMVWLSPVTLWLDAADKSPDKARVHANLGAAYQKADRLDDAIVHHCRALQLAPDEPSANDNLDLALTLRGDYDSVVPEVVERRPDGSVVMAFPAPVTFCPTPGATKP